MNQLYFDPSFGLARWWWPWPS